jgi:hypothetical protein
VDNLMLYVDGRPKSLQTQVHHLNSPHHPGAEPARRAKNYFHDHPSCDSFENDE